MKDQDTSIDQEPEVPAAVEEVTPEVPATPEVVEPEVVAEPEALAPEPIPAEALEVEAVKPKVEERFSHTSEGRYGVGSTYRN